MEVRQVWAESLGRFEGSDIREALDMMLTAHVDYPPTLPQFMGLCNDARRKRTQGTMKLVPPRTSLDDVDPEVLAKVRAFARGKGAA
jgi:hypothetical protein